MRTGRAFNRSISATEFPEHRNTRARIVATAVAPRLTKTDQRAVAEEFVQTAAAAPRQIRQRRKELIEQHRQVFRLEAFGQRGEVRDIDERNRQPTTLQRHLRRDGFGETLGHRRRDIARQPVALPFEIDRYDAQPFAHAGASASSLRSRAHRGASCRKP